MADIHPPDRAAVERMWDDFKQTTGFDGELAGAFAFGDSPSMADELAALVRHGPKRATAGLRLEYEHDGDPIPRSGDHWVVVGADGRPVCVIRTTRVDIVPLDLVDAEFAWDEGEGDRSLAYWQAAHRRYFTRACERIGVPFRDDLPVVLERFDMVWPLPAG